MKRKDLVYLFTKLSFHPRSEYLAEHLDDTLAYLADGMTHKEIGKIFHISPGAIEMRKNAIIRTLYRRLYTTKELFRLINQTNSDTNI